MDTRTGSLYWPVMEVFSYLFIFLLPMAKFVLFFIACYKSDLCNSVALDMQCYPLPTLAEKRLP